MPDLREYVEPSPESRLRLRRIRARIVAGLVQLAGVEPDEATEISDEQRRRVIEAALKDLDAALAELTHEIDPTTPGGPRDGELGDAQRLRATIDEATATVRRLLGDVASADPDRLGGFPEEARKPLSKLINEWCPVRKIIVAVHGIGDQFHNETVQSVAFRVCDYVGAPAALPLGRFHGPGATITGAFLPDPDRDPPLDCGFAEIYWADVPRVPAADQHTLEAPTKWARALVERLRLHAPDPEQPLPRARKHIGARTEARRNDERLEQLLEELIQGVVVADRLVFLADKAGLFHFDLKKLLNDYLNDVQVVTEFEDYRRQLLEIFDTVLEKIHRYFYSSEIYIVAHSEGTVVAFMGLLRGLSQGARWIGMVRGLMTIGSPLNKHVRFWPELFDQFPPPAVAPVRRIAWKNYYDHGDPIGFDLAPTRAWMAERGWAAFFAFEDLRDDIGFTRYYFPGEAHNDYWKDPEVFGHFLQEVVDPAPSRELAVLPRAQEEPYGVPRTVRAAWLTSYVLPYVLSASLLFLASYILYKAVRACLDPIGARFESSSQVMVNVLGLFGLVAGMSLLARIPHLTRHPGWRILALLLGLLSFLYVFVSPDNQRSIERFLDGGRFAHPVLNGYNEGLLAAVVLALLLQWGIPGLRPIVRTLVPVVLWVLALRLAGGLLAGALPRLPAPLRWESLAVISVAWALGIMAWATSWRYPQVGTRPLVHTGGLLILLIVATQIVFHPTRLSNRDRVVVAGAVNDKLQDLLGRLAARAEAPGTDPVGDPALVAEAATLQVVTDAALEQGPIWPVLVAGAAFLYLWWIAIITFDLTFVWHLYIRHAGAQKYIERRLAAARGRDPKSGRAVRL